MSNLFWNVISQLGTAAVIAGAIVYISKMFFAHLLKRDLEHEKAILKRAGEESLARLQGELRGELERELVSRKGQIDDHLAARREEAEQVLASFKAELERELADRRAQVEERLRLLDTTLAEQRSFDERVRTEIERWANPILGSVRALLARLGNILFQSGAVVLAADYSTGAEWSIDHAYMLQTTVYLFGQFFCWSRLLEERLRYDLFRSQVDKDAFLRAMRAVGEPLSAFPLWELLPKDRQKVDALPLEDRQVFSGQQRAMGETLIVERGTEPSCMRLAEFLDRYKGDEFKIRFEPMSLLLTGLKPETRRWLRLELVFAALQTLERACEASLSPRQG
jgi:hypothetical protein